MISIHVDLVGDTTSCGLDCPVFIGRWLEWWAAKTMQPLAILDCTPGYRERIGRNARNMLRKADRLYTYKLIDRSDHLDAIHAVNVSLPERQGRPMTAAYRERPIPSTAEQLCRVHRDEWHAGFDAAGTLRAYARLEVLNESGILNTILGDRTAGGVMNGLIAHLVETTGVRWLNYLRIPSATVTLSEFKQRLGFEAVLAR